MNKIIAILIALLIFNIQVFSHSGKPKYHVIIDTDGALDDMRSISMFLSGNDIRVLAITCSQGTLKPNDVYLKVRSLLAAFHHEGIPVGISDSTSFKLPVWSSFAQNIRWGNSTYHNKAGFNPNSIEVLRQSMENYKSKITLIALGSLKTYADLLSLHPEIIKKIDRIIWYNNHDITRGFNYLASKVSFEFIKKSSVKLEIVSNNSNNLLVNYDYLNKIKQTVSIYSLQINEVHKQSAIINRINQKHLHLWDDIVPLYLTVPILFETKEENQLKFVALNKGIPVDFVYETIAKLLISATQTNNRVFVNFPVDTALYKPEYGKIVSSSIKKYGLIEWKAITMTNEIHGHTGIYSIIGAKMGVRAMDYFNVGVNNLQVTSFAGNKPPLSCFNDGIQISSGATIGQGLITISDSVSNIPSAIFEFNNRRVLISVKEHIANQMQREIKHGVKNFGLLTDRYWLYIEELALKYWADFDRHKVFVIKELEN